MCRLTLLLWLRVQRAAVLLLLQHTLCCQPTQVQDSAMRLAQVGSVYLHLFRAQRIQVAGQVQSSTDTNLASIPAVFHTAP